MELIAILLSGLLAIISPVGLAVDKVAEKAIRSRFDKVEQLQVRLDNAPNHQLLQGKIQQLQIAGRGFWITPEFRVDTLELETDPIDVDLKGLRQRSKEQSFKQFLRQPGQAGLRLVLTEKDLNQALASPKVKEQLQNLMGNLGSSASVFLERYDLADARVEFLENNRLRLQAQLEEPVTGETLNLIIESGINVITGSQLNLIEPNVLVNGKPVPPQLIKAFTAGINRRLDLRRLEEADIIARILQLKLDSDRLQVAAFVRIQPPKS